MGSFDFSSFLDKFTAKYNPPSADSSVRGAKPSASTPTYRATDDDAYTPATNRREDNPNPITFDEKTKQLIKDASDLLPEDLKESTMDELYDRHNIDDDTEITQEDFNDILYEELGPIGYGALKLMGVLDDAFTTISGGKESFTKKDLEDFLWQYGVNVEDGTTVNDIINTITA